MRKLYVFLAAICIFGTQNAGFAQSSQKWFTTYYATWSMLPLGSTNFALPPWEIDYTGLTHIVLFDNGNITQTAPYWAYMFGAPPSRPSDTESDSVCVEYNGVANPGNGNFPRYMDSLITISHRKGVKVVITIQAVNPVNLNYVASDSSRAQLLVNTLVAWAERKKFDGVELDWEGWAAPLPSPDVINRFMRILYRRVHAMRTVSGAPGIIMVSAGSGQQTLYTPSQDYMVDQFNLQLYDYAYAWYGKISSNASWHISPLHRGTVDPTFEGMSYDTRGPLQWVAAGHDPKRIGLGIPTYGYILRNVDGLFQPMANPDYGSAHYQTIEALKSNGGVEEWDDVRKVRSIHGVAQRTVGSVYYGSDGINAGQKFYAVGENPQSLQEKINWMNQNNFGGIMTYDFVSDLDPTQSIASGKRNPLQRVVANALGSGGSVPSIVPLGTFTASASSVPASGGSVTLSWTSSNAASASIDQGVGTVAVNGSTTVSVTANKTYTLTLVSSTGAIQQYQTSITVNAPAPSGTFSASTQSLPAGGGSVTLNWTSVNAASASIDQGVGAVAVNGSTTVSVTSTKTYTLTLTGSTGATVSYTVPVTVASASGSAQSKTIYTDNALASPWSFDGTYSTTFDPANKEKILSGASSIKFAASGWAGILLRNGTWSSASAVDPSQYDSLHFAVHGGTTGAAFALWLTDASGTGIGSQVKFSVPANVWTVKSIPMSQFAAGATSFAVIMLQLYQGTAVTFYVDDVALIGKAPAVVIPAVPTFVTPASGSTNAPTSLVVAWTRSAGAATYHLQLSTDSGFKTFVVNDSTLADTLRGVTGLSNSTVYYRRVRAKNSAGWSAFSATSQFTTIGAPPLAPVPASPANGAVNQALTLSLSWNAAADAATYRLQLASDALFSASSMIVNDSTLTSNSRTVTVSAYVGTYYWRVNAKNAAGTSAYSAVQKFTTAAYVKTKPYFTFASATGSNATVAVPSSAVFAIGGSTLAAGDEIGAFTPSGLCVGAIEWTGANAALTIWGDNVQTPALDGIRSGETIQYRVYRQAINTVYALVSAQYQSGTGMYQPDAIFQLAGLSTVTAPETQVSQSIQLVKGWNMVASYVKPNVTAVDSLTAPLAPSMTIIKNIGGQMYWPSMSINTLGFWNYTQGYMVYMENAGTFTVSGPAIQPESSPIAMAQGWNLAPYMRTSSMNAATALSTIASSLTIVKNNAGQVYWPAYNINTIGSMMPGQAYQLFLTQASTLLYPANAAAKSGSSEIVHSIPVHYPSLADRSGDSQILLVKVQGAQDGDEIAVKTAANLIAGTGVVADGAALVAVWPDESLTTGAIEGALAGQKLTLMRWSKSENTERPLALSRITDGLSGAELGTTLTFQTNGLAVVQTSIQTSEQNPAGVPTEYALMQNYPNPFNPSTVIQYAIPADGYVTLEIFSMLGERMGVLVSGTQRAGRHEVSFNASGYPSGVYFYTLKAGAYSASRRMILLK